MAKVKGIFTAKSVMEVEKLIKDNHHFDYEALPDEIYDDENGEQIWIYNEVPTCLIKYELSRMELNSRMPVFLQNNVALDCLNAGEVNAYVKSHLREFGYEEKVERKRRIM